MLWGPMWVYVRRSGWVRVRVEERVRGTGGGEGGWAGIGSQRVGEVGRC